MMDAPRLTVALTIDHDAISDAVRRGDPPVKVSHAEFGPRVGIKRILALLASRAIPATFFVPGHTLTTFTDDTEAIVAGGHELACHGWFHEDFAELGADQAREVLGRSVEAVRAVTGSAPTGFRAPYWSLGPQTLELVEAAGFTYDSSLMANDYDLYRVRRGDRHSMLDGTQWGAPGGSSRSRSTGRWTTGRISSPVRAGRACRRRQPSSRSGPRSCLRPRARPGRPGDDHGPPRMHRPRPSDGDARTLHRSGRRARWRRLRTARRRRQSLGGGSPLTIALARARTAWNIGAVSRPVNVFCWLGWYVPRSV